MNKMLIIEFTTKKNAENSHIGSLSYSAIICIPLHSNSKCRTNVVKKIQGISGAKINPTIRLMINAGTIGRLDTATTFIIGLTEFGFLFTITKRRKTPINSSKKINSAKILQGINNPYGAEILVSIVGTNPDRSPFEAESANSFTISLLLDMK